jgi:deazaflavin-dependent oxidoreductase (nitroreductase family)
MDPYRMWTTPSLDENETLDEAGIWRAARLLQVPMTTTRDQYRSFNENLIEHFRSNRGAILEGPFKGGSLLLLTTTGKRSGAKRVNPLAYTRDGERYVVIASKGGAPTHPDWYLNLVANPKVTVEVGAEEFAARASVPEGAERDRLYDAQAKVMPGFAQYQRNTTRRIPVVVLERLD